jgi:hypothetical protein
VPEAGRDVPDRRRPEEDLGDPFPDALHEDSYRRDATSNVWREKDLTADERAR